MLHCYVMLFHQFSISNLFIAGFPQKLIVNLKGAAYDTHHILGGTYILRPNQVNDKAHWIKQEDSKAIWYDKEFRTWRISDGDGLGGTFSGLKTSDNAIGPHVANWKYCSNSFDGGWSETTDLVMLAASGI